MEEIIKVLLVEPGQTPRAVAVERSSAAFRGLVEGATTKIQPSNPVFFVCNADYKNSEMNPDLLPNRVLLGSDRKVACVIHGKFFICGENATSIPSAMLKKYANRFKTPDQFAYREDGALEILHLECENGLSQDIYKEE